MTQLNAAQMYGFMMAQGYEPDERMEDLDWRQFTVELFLPRRIETDYEAMARHGKNIRWAKQQAGEHLEPDAHHVSYEGREQHWHDVINQPMQKYRTDEPLKGLTDAIRQACFDEFGTHRFGRRAAPRRTRAVTGGGVAKYTIGRVYGENGGTRVWFILEIAVGDDESIPAQDPSGHVVNALRAGLRKQGWGPDRVTKIRVTQRKSWTEHK